MYHLQRCGIEPFLIKTTPRTTVSKNGLYRLMMWPLRHFDDLLNKMKGLQEPTVQTSTGGSCMCNQAQQEKGTFQRLEIYKHDSAQQ